MSMANYVPSELIAELNNAVSSLASSNTAVANNLGKLEKFLNDSKTNQENSDKKLTKKLEDLEKAVKNSNSNKSGSYKNNSKNIDDLTSQIANLVDFLKKSNKDVRGGETSRTSYRDFGYDDFASDRRNKFNLSRGDKFDFKQFNRFTNGFTMETERMREGIADLRSRISSNLSGISGELYKEVLNDLIDGTSTAAKDIVDITDAMQYGVSDAMEFPRALEIIVNDITEHGNELSRITNELNSIDLEVEPLRLNVDSIQDELESALTTVSEANKESVKISLEDMSEIIKSISKATKSLKTETDEIEIAKIKQSLETYKTAWGAHINTLQNGDKANKQIASLKQAELDAMLELIDKEHKVSERVDSLNKQKEAEANVIESLTKEQDLRIAQINDMQRIGQSFTNFENTLNSDISQISRDMMSISPKNIFTGNSLFDEKSFTSFSSLFGRDERNAEIEAFNQQLDDTEAKYGKMSEHNLKVIAQEENNISDAEKAINKADSLIDEISDTINLLDSQIASVEDGAEKTELMRQKQIKEAEKKERQRDKDKLVSEKLFAEKRKQIAERENQMIDKALENIKEQRKVTDYMQSALGKTLKYVETAVTDMATKLFSDFSSKTNEMYSVIEKTQSAMAKTLKMTNGEFDKYVDQLQELAKEQGVAISTKDLLEVSESVAQAGIVNEDLLAQIALGQAKITETGGNFRMDENFLKDLQQEFNKAIDEGFSQEDALSKVQTMMDSFIATEFEIQEKFGSNVALSNGGAQELYNTLSRIYDRGEMSAEALQKNYYEIASVLEAVESRGADSSALLNQVMTMTNKTASDMSTEELSFLRDYFGVGENGSITDSMVDEFRKSIEEGRAGDVLEDYIMHLSKLYDTGNIESMQYVAQAFGNSLNTDQLSAFINNSDNIINSIEQNKISADDFNSGLASINESIKKGDFLTAQESYEEKMLDTTVDIAQTMQNLPNGDFWMGKGFGAIESIFSGAIGGLMGSLNGNLGKLFGGGGTIAKGIGESGTGGVGGALSLKGGASVGGMAIGGALSGVSLAEHLYKASIDEGVTIGDALEETLKDPQFTAGLGTTLGSALAGPIGGVIGGALGAVVPKISDGVEWLLEKTDPILSAQEKNLEREAEVIEANKQRMDEAAQALESAADSHSAEAERLQNNIKTQTSIFNEFSDKEKENWLVQEGVLSRSEVNNASQDEINTKFSEAIEKWISAQNELIEKEKAKAQIGQFSKGLGEVVGVDNLANHTMDDLYDLSEDKRAELAEKYETTNNKELLAKWNADEEHEANVRKMAYSGLGYEQLDILETFMGEGGELNDAIEEYFKDSGYSEKELTEIKKIYNDLADNRRNYDTANDEFQNRWKEIKEANADLSFDGLVKAYIEKFGNVPNIQGMSTNDNMYGHDNVLWDKNGNPVLQFMDDDGKAVYHPSWFAEGKYLGGLDYVPHDEFGAILHEGEMVLTKVQAEGYRASSNSMFAGIIDKSVHESINDALNNAVTTNMNGVATTTKDIILDTSPITSSIDSQTDKVINLLEKILVRLSGNTYTRVPNNSIVQLDSSIGRM